MTIVWFNTLNPLLFLESSYQITQAGHHFVSNKMWWVLAPSLLPSPPLVDLVSSRVSTMHEDLFLPPKTGALRSCQDTDTSLIAVSVCPENCVLVYN